MTIERRGPGFGSVCAFVSLNEQERTDHFVEASRGNRRPHAPKTTRTIHDQPCGNGHPRDKMSAQGINGTTLGTWARPRVD